MKQTWSHWSRLLPVDNWPSLEILGGGMLLQFLVLALVSAVKQFISGLGVPVQELSQLRILLGSFQLIWSTLHLPVALIRRGLSNVGVTLIISLTSSLCGLHPVPQEKAAGAALSQLCRSQNHPLCLSLCFLSSLHSSLQCNWPTHFLEKKKKVPKHMCNRKWGNQQGGVCMFVGVPLIHSHLDSLQFSLRQLTQTGMFSLHYWALDSADCLWFLH